MDLDRKALGEQLRQLRKSKNLIIKDIDSMGLSGASASKIENGHPSVGLKMIKKYCGILGFDFSKSPMLDTQTVEKDQDKPLKLKLLIIENMIRDNHPKLALEKLKELDLHPSHPLKATQHFLRAKIYLLKGNVNEAENYFEKAIQSIENHPEYALKSNIKANAFVELGSIEYKKSNFTNALKFAKRAEESFIDNGMRKFLKHVILMNQAVYLELLNKNEKAQDILNNLKNEVHQIEHVDVILNMYDVNAILRKKSGQYRKAIESIEKGLEIAIQNNKHGRAGELWKTLGIITKSMHKNSLAIGYLETAKFLLSHHNKKHQLIVVDKELAEIYNQQKKWRKAKNLLQSSLANIDISKTHILRYIQAKLTIGISCYHLKEYEEANEHFEQALKLSKKHNLRNLEYKTILELGKLLKETDQNMYNQNLNELFRLAVELDEGGEINE
ncbi:Tetratricopeptide repeat-containing protein [Seinonella peptonophila]|uniref:Tetratricopeptide repeat-containing protein n=1 Tax=Seinonella peptonophila TaxID=112248 RepID=A0A1M5AV29_9BACL|nr:helix-turn-helix domain-containing protein [Seinonella peptonophila]SHF34073.1 Tetratricopeptide repeat-containing protein [Seinonella peptonophila]